MIPTALSIAGSDPSGGAGIQADLKTFADHGVYGMAVISAITVQNTRGVTAVHPVAPEVVGAQIRAVLDDIPPGAVKIGMLSSLAVVRAVADTLAGFDRPVVLDPVLVATSGAALLAPEAERALLDLLVPRVALLTPNLPEARRLLGEEAPSAWVDRTGVALLRKGGHGEGEVTDELWAPNAERRVWRHPRLCSANTHGTGCTLSSAIAARLARGEDLASACGGAITYVARLIGLSDKHGLGGGNGPLLHGR